MYHPLYELEHRLRIGPTKTARFLGYSYSTYAQYKNGRRELKPYLVAHVEALLFMPEDMLFKLLEDSQNVGD